MRKVTTIEEVIKNTGKFSSVNVPKYYHISFDKGLPNYLVGKIPDGYVESNSSLQEPSIPRVSFSVTLVGAFRGVFSNLTEEMVRIGSTGITYQVYQLTAIDGVLLDYSQLKPFVHDADVTKEAWVVGNCKVKPIGTVTYSYDASRDYMTYKPFGTGVLKPHSPAMIAVDDSGVRK